MMRGEKPKRKNGLFSRLAKLWGTIFFLIIVVFLAVTLYFNVLPTKYLLILTGISAFIGIITIPALLSVRFKAGRRVTAFFISLLFGAMFLVGIFYMTGTISFFSDISNIQGKHGDIAKRVDVNNESYNVFVSGLDTYGSIDTESRSDVNMVVTVNPKTKKVLLTSIPRDYRIRLVDMGNVTDKMTHTGVYGIDQTVKSAEDLLNIDINYYVKVNFSTVVEFINAIDGVDVTSEENIEIGGKAGEYIQLQKGKNHLNGSQALVFARERYAYEAGDIQRNKNQQIIMKSIIEKATSSVTILFKYYNVLNTLGEYVETNMQTDEMKALIRGQLLNISKWDVSMQNLDGVGNMAPLYSTGGAYAYVMEDDENAIRNAYRKILDVMEGR